MFALLGLCFFQTIPPLEERLLQADAVVVGKIERSMNIAEMTLRVQRSLRASRTLSLLTIPLAVNDFSLPPEATSVLVFLKSHGSRWALMNHPKALLACNQRDIAYYIAAVQEFNTWQKMKPGASKEEARLQWWLNLAEHPATRHEVAEFFLKHSFYLTQLNAKQRKFLVDACVVNAVQAPSSTADLLMAFSEVAGLGFLETVTNHLRALAFASKSEQPYLEPSHWIRTESSRISEAIRTLSPPSSSRGPQPPGFSGTMPSLTAQQRISTMKGRAVTGVDGKEWKLTALVFMPIPHSFSGKRGGKSKGPHAIFSNGKERYVLPLEADGDLAELAHQLKGVPHPTMRGLLSKAYLEVMEKDPLYIPLARKTLLERGSEKHSGK